MMNAVESAQSCDRLSARSAPTKQITVCAEKNVVNVGAGAKLDTGMPAHSAVYADCSTTRKGK
jgi:hypothetical protein